VHCQLLFIKSLPFSVLKLISDALIIDPVDLSLMEQLSKYHSLTSDDLSFKLIVIGESGVGKSCLTKKATKNVFDTNYHNTVGFEFSTFNLKLNDEKVVKLQIWDTCGQEIYRSLVTGFYRNSSLAIIVYSIDNADSLETAESWLRELRNYSSPDIKIFLIGNKSDLENNRKVKTEDGVKFKENNQLDLFLETSARTGFNSKAVFVEAAKILYRDYLKYKDNFSVSSRATSFRSDLLSNHIRLKSQSDKTLVVDNQNNKKGCC